MNKTLLLSGVSAFALALGMSAPAFAGGAVALINAQMGDGGQVDIIVGDTVTGNSAQDNGSFRHNDVMNSYTGASGIAHVQQNEGSSNAIQAATAVQANINGGGLVVTGAFVNSNTWNNWTIDNNGERHNQIMGSFNGFAGVATVQQNNGDNNEIGAATAVHTNNGGDGSVGQFAVTMGSTGQQYGAGYAGYEAIVDNNSLRDNTIDPSFEDASGVVTVQQNNGNGNAISAATAVAGNIGNGWVGQAALTFGSIGISQGTVDMGLSRDNLIQDSFTRFSGVATVQQNNGDANVLGAATTVAANIGGGLNNGLDQLGNNVMQAAGTSGGVSGVWAGDWDSQVYVWEIDPDTGEEVLVFSHNQGLRDNSIDNSFTDAEGVATVQQNNGSNNVMGAATAVQGNINTGPAPDLDGDDDVLQIAVTVGGTVENAGAEFGFPATPPPAGTDPVHRANSIMGSFNGYAGVATVQQNNGDNNVIGAASAVVGNVGSGDKTDNSASLALTMGNATGNYAREYDGANRDNTIDPSFAGARGVITVQQNNGNNNVMGVANTVVANVDNENDTAAAMGANAAGGLANVSGNFAQDHTNTDRVNSVANGSFNDAAGIMTVQQNNGENNVMGASNAVAVDVNGGGANGFGAALSLAVLNASVSGNTTIVNGTSVYPGYLNSVDSSFTGAAGVMTVQQNNGSNNAIQSAISVTANF